MLLMARIATTGRSGFFSNSPQPQIGLKLDHGQLNYQILLQNLIAITILLAKSVMALGRRFFRADKLTAIKLSLPLGAILPHKRTRAQYQG